MRGVTPLATRSRRLRVSPGKRRAAQPAARLSASRGLTSRPLARLVHLHEALRVLQDPRVALPLIVTCPLPGSVECSVSSVTMLPLACALVQEIAVVP